jgi:hypothetical protein
MDERLPTMAELEARFPKEEGISIKAGRPPNFAAICRVFPRAAERGTIFTYGHTVWVSDGADLPRSLVAHETVHVTQQELMGPEEWWDRYLTDPAFRFGQETAAHIMEYSVACEGAGRNVRRQQLARIAKRLSGPLYGHMTTYAKARELLKL